MRQRYRIYMNLALRNSLIFSLLLLYACTGRPTLHALSTTLPNNLATADLTIKDVRFEKQASKYACGIASLISVLDYWDIEAEQSVLSEKYPYKYKGEGYSMRELKEIALKSGAQAFVLQGDKDFLKEQILLGRPIIVPVYMVTGWRINILGHNVYGGSYNHYVVVIGFSDNKVTLIDPDKGYRTIPERQFFKMWEVNEQMSLLVAKSA